MESLCTLGSHDVGIVDLEARLGSNPPMEGQQDRAEAIDSGPVFEFDMKASEIFLESPWRQIFFNDEQKFHYSGRWTHASL